MKNENFRRKKNNLAAEFCSKDHKLKILSRNDIIGIKFSTLFLNIETTFFERKSYDSRLEGINI